MSLNEAILNSKSDFVVREQARKRKREDTEALNRIIGSRLIKARVAQGFKPSDITEAFPNLNKSHLSEWEGGTKPIPAYWLRELARHYGVSLDYLTGDSNDCEEQRSAFEMKRTLRSVTEQYVDNLAAVFEQDMFKKMHLLGCYDQVHSIGKDLIQAFNRMIEVNPEAWQEIIAGARLESTVARLNETLNGIETMKKQNEGVRDLQVYESHKRHVEDKGSKGSLALDLGNKFESEQTE